MPPLKVGFIGLGAMGEGMCRNLKAAGLLTCVWNRNVEKAIDLGAELEVNVAASPAALAAHNDVIMLCVADDGAVKAMVDALSDGLSDSKVVIDCSTISSHTAREVAQTLARVGVDYLDAPVSGGVEGAKNATLAVMLGGDAAILEKVRPALIAISKRIVHMGPVGSGQATKAVNQIMAAGINQAVTEALAFASASELDMDKVVDVVSGGAAGNWFLQHRGPSLARGQFTPGFKLALHHKDLSICQSMAEDLGVELPLTNTTLNDYSQLIDQGCGEEDISALYRLKNDQYKCE